MKRQWIASFVLGSMLVTGIVHTAKAEGKIALVSLQSALNGVEEGKKAKAALQATFATKQKEIDTLKNDLQKMKDDLDKQKSVLSEDALRAKANEMQAKYADLQQKAMSYEQELKDKESESVQKILEALKTTVQDVAKKGGYDLVFENSAETVLYSTNATDITAEVIKSYNTNPPAKKK